MGEKVDHNLSAFAQRPYAWRMDYFAHCCAWWMDQWEKYPHSMPTLQPKAVVRPEPRDLKEFYSPS
jgi:hypothetical protein